MPPSQLKRLKASLREQGITGPPKSKKGKKVAPTSEQRSRKENALASIRDSFNPFEIKTSARPRKFDVTSSKTINGREAKSSVSRPGVSKSHGEEKRRQMLLSEMHMRNKVGGIRDRRFGENDPRMAPEEKLAQRFVREMQRKKSNAFDLEDDMSENELTHGGKPLDFNGSTQQRDDFQEEDLLVSSDADTDDSRLERKRKLIGSDAKMWDNGTDSTEPARKKTKMEVMKELISKSKLHKYERQQAKEDDEDLREELDKGMGDLLAVLRGHSVARPASATYTNGLPSNNMAINPDRARLIKGADKAEVEREYDLRLREMAQDKRAKPAERSKTTEELELEQAERLKDLTEQRLKRMQGETVTDSEEEINGDNDYRSADLANEEVEISEHDDAADFGLKSHTSQREYFGVEDEDDFLLDDDLVAQDVAFDGSEHSIDDDFASESGSTGSHSIDHDLQGREQDQDDDLLYGFLTAEEKSALKNTLSGVGGQDSGSSQSIDMICPTNHDAFLDMLDITRPGDTIPVIQRIRALYNPQLRAGNKEKLGQFSSVLVEHIVYMGDHQNVWPLTVIETAIRHVHSLSRTFADEIANAFRAQLQIMHDTQKVTPGHLVALTAIGSIYPTSDHFHQVVTPAVTIMARWLGLTSPRSKSDHATGAYLSSLCLKFQSLSKRYIPELVRFTILALKAPTCTSDLVSIHLANLSTMADLWSEKTAFVQIMSPGAMMVLQGVCKTADPTLAKDAKRVLQRLRIQLGQSQSSRKPLALHSWRPLPIKMAIPKFEETFNPDRHYDPDRERHESNKLKAEYKKERKGAMRELRKDANFIAREKLREKKERDRLYEEKQRRLIAEINAEEGAEANAYEREKRRRKFGR